jgi:hypothetical protein
MSTSWPPLPYDAWRDTRETLHRYSQIVGKIQLALTPLVNHFWNVILRITPRGLATPALRFGERTFAIELDLVGHRVVIETADGESRLLELRPLAVAEFYRELFAALDSLAIRPRIWDQPVELRTESIPLSQDHVHAAYDRDAVTRFFRVIASTAEALAEFRSRFLGKASEVGLYWGTFDISVARYNGRRAPEVPTGRIEAEAFSHELSEAGFWPGDVIYPEPAFFAFHYPAPTGFVEAAVADGARWYEPSHCFVLPYESCRDGDVASRALGFWQAAYETGANLAGWNRRELER